MVEECLEFEDIFFIVTARHPKWPTGTPVMFEGTKSRFEGCGHSHRTAESAARAHRKQIASGEYAVWMMGITIVDGFQKIEAILAGTEDVPWRTF